MYAVSTTATTMATATTTSSAISATMATATTTLGTATTPTSTSEAATTILTYSYHPWIYPCYSGRCYPPLPAPDQSPLPRPGTILYDWCHWNECNTHHSSMGCLDPVPAVG